MMWTRVMYKWQTCIVGCPKKTPNTPTWTMFFLSLYSLILINDLGRDFRLQHLGHPLHSAQVRVLGINCEILSLFTNFFLFTPVIDCGNGNIFVAPCTPDGFVLPPTNKKKRDTLSLIVMGSEMGDRWASILLSLSAEHILIGKKIFQKKKEYFSFNHFCHPLFFKLRISLILDIILVHAIRNWKSMETIKSALTLFGGKHLDLTFITQRFCCCFCCFF